MKSVIWWSSLAALLLVGAYYLISQTQSFHDLTPSVEATSLPKGLASTLSITNYETHTLPSPLGPSRTIQFVSKVEYDPSQSDKGNAFFSSLQVRYSDGSVKKLPSFTVEVPPNTASYLYLTLDSFQPRLLAKRIHSGGIPIAFLDNTSGSLTVTPQEEFRIPVNYIPNTKRKLRLGEPLRIAILGDWTTDYNLKDDWLKALFAPSQVEVFRITASTGSPSPAWGLTHAATIDHSTPYDLAIIGYGDVGSSSLMLMESLVAQVRREGTEVLLLTHNSKPSDPNLYYSEADHINRIARTWGANLADTWSYVQEMQEHMETVQVDSEEAIHTVPSAWEEAIRSVVMGSQPTSTIPIDLRRVRPINPLEQLVQARTLLQPGLTELEPDQVIQYNLPASIDNLDGVSILTDEPDPFECIIYNGNGLEIGRLAYTDYSSRLELIEVIPIDGDYVNHHGSIQIKVISGQLRLISLTCFGN